MPITPWFHREEILSSLGKRLDGFQAGYRQNCALLGPEAIGKTTLLKRLIQQRGQDPSLISLYLEVREEDGFIEWATRFIQTLFYSVLKTKEVEELPNGLTDLLQVSRSVIPRSSGEASRLLALTDSLKGEELFERLWDLPHLVAQETHALVLIVLDEFQRCRHFPVKESFHRLGRKIMVQSTTMYVVASSQPSMARSILREGFRLLFGQFEVIEMGPLDPVSCLQTIREVWPKAEADPFLEHLLIELTQGYPASLDLLLQGLMALQREGAPHIQERLLLDLLESLFFEPQGSLRLLFEARLKAVASRQGRLKWMEILLGLAGGCRGVQELAQVCERSPARIGHVLRILEQSGLAVKEGVFYSLPDRLFQLWLTTTYPLLQGVGLIDPVQARARFRDAIWGWMAEVREAIFLPIEEQAMKFLKLLKGEFVEIDGKRVLLPRFKKVDRFKELLGRPTLLALRAGGKGWWVIPWSGTLDEAQARQLVLESRMEHLKPYRRLLLGPSEVEMNARLILQEARIRLWDLGIFNKLLELYRLTRMPWIQKQKMPPAEHAQMPMQLPSSSPSSSSLRAG